MTQSIPQYLLYKVNGELVRALKLDEEQRAIHPKQLLGCYGLRVRDGQVIIDLRTITITYPLNTKVKNRNSTILFELIGG